MKILKQILFTSFFATFFVAIGQTNEYIEPNRKLKNSQIDQLNAERQIKDLKEGFLIIRLRTRLPLIEALTQSGRLVEAEQVKQKQLQGNKEIIVAFSTWFDFCPTYFFLSNHSDFIRENMLDSIDFLNDSAAIDPDIQIPSDNFLIAEFTLVDKDTATFPGGTYIYRGENGLERRTYYEGGGNFGFEALVFKSKEFYQLRRPFPYYSRTLQSLPIFRRSYKRVIQRANETLHYYYNKVY